MRGFFNCCVFLCIFGMTHYVNDWIAFDWSYLTDIHIYMMDSVIDQLVKINKYTVLDEKRTNTNENLYYMTLLHMNLSIDFDFSFFRVNFDTSCVKIFSSN